MTREKSLPADERDRMMIGGAATLGDTNL